MHRAVRLFTFAGISLICAQVFGQQHNLNVELMESTFFLSGPGKTPAENKFGTAFLLLRPYTAQPRKESILGRGVLITAAHVLEDITGNEANLTLRRVDPNGQWFPISARLAIRRAGQPLWKKLPDVDVAAMYVAWPLPNDHILPVDVLVDDTTLKKAEVGPGAQLSVLGYPLGAQSNSAGFPILRTGVIASYPLLPTSVVKTFLLDFRVFQGNSGGPVYYSESVPKGSAVLCCAPQFIMGLVSQEESLNMPYSQLQLSLAVVVDASSIKATVESLPAPETADFVQVQLLPVAPTN